MMFVVPVCIRASSVKMSRPDCWCFTQDVSVGGSTCGRANMKLIRTLLDQMAGQPFVGRTVDVLSDTVSSQKTPVRFPSLLSKFRYVFSEATSFNLYILLWQSQILHLKQLSAKRAM